jgi:hypothetical protein
MYVLPGPSADIEVDTCRAGQDGDDGRTCRSASTEARALVFWAGMDIGPIDLTPFASALGL